MDAYVFASTASDTAVAVLRAAAGAGGPIRAVFPLEGDRALYVAVFGDDAATIDRGIRSVLDTPGVGDTETYRRADPGGAAAAMAYPTHCAVNAWVGLAVLPATGQPPPGVNGVVGFAVVERDGQTHAIVEVHGPRNDVLAALQQLGGGATPPVFSAYGDTSRGTWHPAG
ncbi:MAG TPA: hypothetical protein VNA20_09480 [Frankiaceae bacterium]|nr:hypothetical protein [Frankiaceae bacterium]